MFPPGYDYGVFACMFADFIMKDYPLTFIQRHISKYRERIALMIITQYAMFLEAF